MPNIPPVETPPFDGTRCPPLLTGAGRKFRPRRTGRGSADGTARRAGPYGAAVPHEHTARTHRSEVHISTPRRRQRRALSRHDSDTRALLAARSSDVLRRMVSDDQGGRGWRASLRDMRCSEYSTVCVPISSVCSSPCMSIRKIAACVHGRMPASDSDCSFMYDARAMPGCITMSCKYASTRSTSAGTARARRAAHVRARHRDAYRRRQGRRAIAMYAKERLGEIFRRRPRAELDVKNPAAARRRNSPLQFSALRPRAQL